MSLKFSKEYRRIAKLGKELLDKWALTKCKVCGHVFSFAHWVCVDEWGRYVGYFCEGCKRYQSVNQVEVLGYDPEHKHLSAYPPTQEAIHELVKEGG